VRLKIRTTIKICALALRCIAEFSAQLITTIAMHSLDRRLPLLTGLLGLCSSGWGLSSTGHVGWLRSDFQWESGQVPRFASSPLLTTVPPHEYEANDVWHKGSNLKTHHHLICPRASLCA
jgi:hypothetical protein